MGHLFTRRVAAVVVTASMVFAVLMAAPQAFATAPGSVGSWTTSSNQTPVDVSGAPSVEYNGYAYVLGGTSSDLGSVDSNYVFYAKLSSNGSVGSWTTSSNSLPQYLYYPSAAAANGYIYVMGGYAVSGGFQSAVYYAKINSDGSIGTWTTSSNSLPQAMYEGSGATNNGYIYFLGGINSSEAPVNTVYYAKLASDGSVGSWTTNTNHLPQSIDDTATFTNGGDVYVLGGVTNSSTSNAVYYARFNSDGSIGTWTTSSNSLPQALDGPTAASAGGYVYVTGGNNSSDDSQNTVYYAPLSSNGSVGSWTTSSNSLPQTVQLSSSITYDGYLYVFDGQNNGNTVKTVYYAPLTLVSQESVTNAQTTEPVSLATPAGTNITNLTATTATTPNSGYTYPLSLVNFTFATNTLENQVSLNFQTNLTPSQVVAQKYNPNTQTYVSIPGAVVTQTTLSGQPALNVSYTIADGGPLDEDGTVNGVIVDPVTLAETTVSTSTTTSAQAPNTGYGQPASGGPLMVATGFGALLCVGSGLLILRRRTPSKQRQ